MPDPIFRLRVLAERLVALRPVTDEALHLHRVLRRDPVEQLRHLEARGDAHVLAITQRLADHAHVHGLRRRRCQVSLAVVDAEYAGRLMLRHAQLHRLVRRDLVDDASRTRRPDQRSRAAHAIDRGVLAVCLADVMHEHDCGACLVGDMPHRGDRSVHGDVIVFANCVGADPRVNDDDADVMFVYLLDHVIN